MQIHLFHYCALGMNFTKVIIELTNSTQIELKLEHPLQLYPLQVARTVLNFNMDHVLETKQKPREVTFGFSFSSRFIA